MPDRADKTVVEVLYPEYANQAGDNGNAMYLRACLPDATFVETSHDDVPYFAEHVPSLVLLCGMSEAQQEKTIELLMPYRDFLPRAAAMRRKFLSDQTAALTLLAAHYRLDCEQVRRRLKSLAYELSLYRKGVPVSEIKPLSLRCQAERRLAIDGFTRPKRPVSLSGIDVFGDDGRSSAE